MKFPREFLPAALCSGLYTVLLIHTIWILHMLTVTVCQFCFSRPHNFQHHCKHSLKLSPSRSNQHRSVIHAIMKLCLSTQNEWSAKWIGIQGVWRSIIKTTLTDYSLNQGGKQTKHLYLWLSYRVSILVIFGHPMERSWKGKMKKNKTKKKKKKLKKLAGTICEL